MITLSERARSKLVSPHFYTEAREFEEFKLSSRPGQFIFVFEHKKISSPVTFFGLVDLSHVDRKILGLKFTTDLQGGTRAFLEGAVELLQGKKLQDLTALKVREVDYFLRDSNDKSAFPEGTLVFYPLLEFLPLLQKEIQKICGQKRGAGEKISPVIGEDYVFRKETTFVPTYGQQTFIDLDRDTQFDLAQQVMDKFINPALRLDQGAAQVVYVDGNMIVLIYQGACSSCGLSLTSTLDFVQKVFQLELSWPKIRVMTDN